MKDALLALGARAMFLAHGLVAVWKCQHRYKKSFMFILLAPVLTLFGEALFTIAIRGGREYKFISPCIALYLGSVVPAIWFLEIKSYFDRQVLHVCQDTRAWLRKLPKDATSSAGCEFRFTSYVRYDFAVENTLRKVNESYNKAFQTYYGKDNATSIQEHYYRDVEEKIRSHLEKLVLSNCTKIIAEDLEVRTRFLSPSSQDPIGTTIWSIDDEKDDANCLSNESYSDDGKKTIIPMQTKENFKKKGNLKDTLALKSTFQWQRPILERACEFQYGCEKNKSDDCYFENEQIKKEEREKSVNEEGSFFASTNETEVTQASIISDSIDNWIRSNIPIFNSDDDWINILHQLILFIIIIGRWMLPKAEGVSRDQLSQVLLIFIGVGADILEFVTETIKEMEVRCSFPTILIMLGLWTWSLIQFILVVTGTSKTRTTFSEVYGSKGESPVMLIEEEVELTAWESFWSNPEVWSILTTVVLQDGPFWAMRMYIIIGRKVVHPTILFFTIKNGLVLLLETYRLAIIATTKEGDDDEDEEVDEEDILEDDEMPIQKKSKKSDVNTVDGKISTPKKNKN